MSIKSLAVRAQRPVQREAVRHPPDLRGVLAVGLVQLPQQAGGRHVVVPTRLVAGGGVAAALVEGVLCVAKHSLRKFIAALASRTRLHMH